MTGQTQGFAVLVSVGSPFGKGDNMVTFQFLLDKDPAAVSAAIHVSGEDTATTITASVSAGLSVQNWSGQLLAGLSVYRRSL